MDYLKLKTKSHPHHTIGWIKNDPSIKVKDVCHVSISIGKFYQDYVTCDVVVMDKCHILLGRPLQHDVDATHVGCLEITKDKSSDANLTSMRRSRFN